MCARVFLALGWALALITAGAAAASDATSGPPTQTAKTFEKRITCDLTGLSMGGYGAWSLATSHPERFAAVAPICGGGDPADVQWMKQTKAKAFETLGVWAFHGAKDQAVPLRESQEMVDAFKEAGCKDIQLTVYPNAGHNAWTEAYNNPKLYDWFLQHRRD